MELGMALWLGFLAVASVQVVFWAVFLWQLFRLKREQRERQKSDSPPVSLIIAARNESENLLTHLPKWIKLLRPEDELVVVNDRSSDDTHIVLHAFQQRYTPLKVVTINEMPAREMVFGKKFALTLGIKAATHDFLAFTDADCEPHQDDWLELMREGLSASSLVLGSGFVKSGKGLVSKLAHFDSLHTAILYHSFARLGIPYMGVGRSMAYHRELFHQQGGFQKHRKVQSGDDDLFVSSLSRVRAVSKTDALTWTEAPATFGDYFRQRTRHSTTSFHYKWFHKLLLGLYYLSLGLFWPMFLTILCSGHLWLGLALVGIRLNLQLASLVLLGKLTNCDLKPLRIWWNELILAHFYPLFTIAAKWRKSDRWKV